MSIRESNSITMRKVGQYRIIQIPNQPWERSEFTCESPGAQPVDISPGTYQVMRATRNLKEMIMGVSEMLRNLTEFLKTSLKALVLNLLRESGAPVLDVEILHSESLGLYALATLECNASQALKYWLIIADKSRSLGIPVFITWTGNLDVAPEEMGAYIGKVLAKMNVFLTTKQPLDIVKILREEWGA